MINSNWIGLLVTWMFFMPIAVTFLLMLWSILFKIAGKPKRKLFKMDSKIATTADQILFCDTYRKMGYIGIMAREQAEWLCESWNMSAYEPEKNEPENESETGL